MKSLYLVDKTGWRAVEQGELVTNEISSSIVSPTFRVGVPHKAKLTLNKIEYLLSKIGQPVFDQINVGVSLCGESCDNEPGTFERNLIRKSGAIWSDLEE